MAKDVLLLHGKTEPERSVSFDALGKGVSTSVRRYRTGAHTSPSMALHAIHGCLGHFHDGVGTFDPSQAPGHGSRVGSAADEMK